ncbi:hypothetical protein [Micromonospora sp. WMMD1155]|uniref:hypothetical protein n=1 Tax=Micromonospora sp. WMMD1155 TaxID=3016094 RepID=UPI00249C124E|nr:hypothetical protein [Micromonospora sp. WMMD1155]WFE50001.1 hypothetical protein O7617_06580 [Micromonospora sp. WMMD1155]
MLSDYRQLAQWVDENGEFDIRSFLLLNETVPNAAVLAELFWPHFVEYRGGVFLAFLFEEKGVDMWLENLKGDVVSVESVLNHVHLWDFFSPKSKDEYAGLSKLTERIGTMWREALRVSFPDRSFVVTFTDDPADYGPTLKFTQGT